MTRRLRSRRVRIVAWGLFVVLLAPIVYLGVSFAQVWHGSRLNQARPAQAIVVLGSAQYDGVPSPDLAARLSHALDLYREHLAPLVVVTGGREPGDVHTEAQAGADWLAERGVPQSVILREVSGRDSWQSLAASAAFLRARGVHTVLLVSDPFHDERISLMARELQLQPFVSPTRTSPLKGRTLVPYYAKETVEVALGRIIGFRRMVGVSERVQQAVGRP